MALRGRSWIPAMVVVTAAACSATSPAPSVGPPPFDATSMPGAPSPALTAAATTTVDPDAMTPAAQAMARTLQERHLGSREPCASIPALSIASRTPTTPPQPVRFQCLLDAAERGEARVSVLAKGPRGDGGVLLAMWMLVDGGTVESHRYSIDPGGAVNEQTSGSCTIDRTKSWGDPFSGC